MSGGAACVMTGDKRTTEVCGYVRVACAVLAAWAAGMVGR